MRRRGSRRSSSSSDDAIISKDLNGIVASWNNGAERLFGYAAQEAIGKSIVFLIPLDRRHEETEILERIRRGERIKHYETVRRRNDGSLVEISLTVSPVGITPATSSGHRRSLVTSASESGQRSACPCSPARSTTGRKTSWRLRRRPCTSRRLKRRRLSRMRSEDAFKPSPTRTRCSRKRAGQAPTCARWWRRSSIPIDRKGSRLLISAVQASPWSRTRRSRWRWPCTS